MGRKAKGYREWLVLARRSAGITSIREFDDLNPFLLMALSEGQDWRDYDLARDAYSQRSMSITPVVIADGTEEKLQQAQQSAQSEFDKRKQEIERNYKAPDKSQAAKQSVFANAFKKLFAERGRKK